MSSCRGDCTADLGEPSVSEVPAGQCGSNMSFICLPHPTGGAAGSAVGSMRCEAAIQGQANDVVSNRLEPQKG
jgi:hypothetical protein